VIKLAAPAKFACSVIQMKKSVCSSAAKVSNNDGSILSAGVRESAANVWRMKLLAASRPSSAMPKMITEDSRLGFFLDITLHPFRNSSHLNFRIAKRAHTFKQQ